MKLLSLLPQSLGAYLQVQHHQNNCLGKQGIRVKGVVSNYGLGFKVQAMDTELWVEGLRLRVTALVRYTMIQLVVIMRLQSTANATTVIGL